MFSTRPLYFFCVEDRQELSNFKRSHRAQCGTKAMNHSIVGISTTQTFFRHALTSLKPPVSFHSRYFDHAGHHYSDLGRSLKPPDRLLISQ